MKYKNCYVCVNISIFIYCKKCVTTAYRLRYAVVTHFLLVLILLNG